jgi:hypothetical protein
VSIEELQIRYQQGLEQAKGSMLEVTYQIVVDTLQAGDNLLAIKDYLHMLEVLSFDEKQRVLSVARHEVEHLLYSM